MKPLPPNQRRQFNSELDDLTFAQMELDEKATEVLSISSQPKSKELVEGLRRKIVELGKFIAGEMPKEKDEILSTVFNSAIAGALGGLGSTIVGKVQASLSRTAVQQKDQAGSMFDRLSVHHDVGTRDQFSMRSNVYQVQGGKEKPLKMAEPIITVTKNPQDMLRQRDLNTFLSDRGLELAPPNKAAVVKTNEQVPSELSPLKENENIVLCKHKKVKVSDLDRQRESLSNALNALQESERAITEAQIAFDKANRDLLNKGSIGFPQLANLDSLGDVVYDDVPALKEATAMYVKARWQYGEALQHFASESAKYSGLQREYARDHGDTGWFEVFFDYTKKTFGVLFNLFSKDF